jgi:membrane protease YdiL (CAAX protease family)
VVGDARVDEYITATAMSPDAARREAAAYCMLAFGLTWVPHMALAVSKRPYLQSRVSASLCGLGLAGPTLAAFAVERRTRGRGAMPVLAQAAAPGSTTPARLAGSLCTQPAVIFLAGALANGVKINAVDPAMTIGQVWVVSGEEFGWRGFLLPRLRRIMPATPAIAVMSIIWGGWHLPMFLVKGSPQTDDGFGHFAAAILAWSAVHHLLQVGHPSVLTAMVFHAAANASTNVIEPRNRRWLTAAYLATGALATLATHQLERSRTRFATPERVSAPGDVAAHQER